MSGDFRMSLRFLAALLVMIVTGARAQSSLIEGVEHTPIVVADLDKAVSDFRAMGFAIKPGRFHADGIRNAHVKFPDGTELELITASTANDALTGEYLAKQKKGDGPIYFGLYTHDLAGLAKRIGQAGADVRQESPGLTFRDGDALHPLFFATGETSPTDRPEHFAHANSAVRLSGYWLSGNKSVSALLKKLGVPVHPMKACGPMGAGEDAVLPRGDVVFVKGRDALIGARIAVKNLRLAQEVMEKNGLKPRRACAALWLAPSVGHGLWLQFVQAR
ncbi:MAG TPA: VOC family protein [Rhizomicrobium sp.]|nr:VOC family protein [Rhizomicrobium sp.]